MKKVLNILVVLVIICLIIPTLLLVVDSNLHPDKIPAIFGYKPLIVMSGSMEPIFATGDLAFAKEVDPNTIKQDDIIAFLSEDSHTVITHRVNEIIENDEGETVFKTKGDANNTVDAWEVSKDGVQGLYVSKISGLGYVVLFLQSPAGLLGMILIVVLIGGGIYLIENNNINRRLREENEKMKKEMGR